LVYSAFATNFGNLLAVIQAFIPFLLPKIVSLMARWVICFAFPQAIGYLYQQDLGLPFFSRDILGLSFHMQLSYFFVLATVALNYFVLRWEGKGWSLRLVKSLMVDAFFLLVHNQVWAINRLDA